MLPTGTPQSPCCFAEHQKSNLENCETFGFWITVLEILEELGSGNILCMMLQMSFTARGKPKIEEISLSSNRLYKTLPTFHKALLIPCLTLLVWGKNLGF